jgi:signal transduction histidine kinase/ActR/RegA family two-component response regulator
VTAGTEAATLEAEGAARSPALGYGLAVVSVGAAHVLTVLLYPLIQPSVAPLFFAAVVVTCWYGGLGPGLLATAAASMLTEAFFYAPFYWVDVGTVVRVSTFAVVAVLVASLNARAQAEHRRAAGLAASRERLLVQEQAARAEAERANRAKDEFLATLSHELRTPLNAMLGWLWWLRRGDLDEERGQRALETIERNTRALAQLIEDLLDVSRIITGKLRLEVRAADLVAIITAAVEAVRPAAQAKGIQLDVGLPGSPADVSGDPDRLQQVMWNLLSNAIKFTPEQGRVTVRLTPGARHAEIVVADTGRGIAPELLPYVFDRFRQADASHRSAQGGLGLGLSIVRHLVELHGGTVTAASPGEGQGARFTIRLPVLGEPAAPGTDLRAGRVPEVASPTLDGLRILVVDDDPDARDCIAAMLEKYGARVVVAGSASAALQTLNAFPADVLVSDLRMPGGDGFDLIRRVRARPGEAGRRLAAVALTASPRVEDRARALEAGFDMHVPKPVEAADLAGVVAGLAGRERAA